MRTEAMDVQCAASELAALGEFRQETFPRVGEFFADYSLLTPEEIAQTDLEGVELFKHSLPVSQTGESDLELAELFENSVPVSR
jgi:hypothetical protein